VRESLRPGGLFPDFTLPDHTEERRSLSEIAAAQPLVLCFVRGWWCPKEQVRLRALVDLQEEIQREYGRLAVVTVDEPYVNGAFRAGLGATFPFLSDVDRKTARELDLLESSDAKHEPFLPATFVLDSLLRIHRVWVGFWYWGNPTPDELRLALREVTRAEQPTFEPQAVWAAGGSAGPDDGIGGEAIWIHEDAEGREIQRGVHEGELPAVGDEVGHSSVDGRPWLVARVDRSGARPAIHLRKGGKPDVTRTVRHHVSAPR
jgi:peroxiredoxin